MDYEELLETLKNPEKETIECKQSFADMDDIGRTMAAFPTKRGMQNLHRRQFEPLK